jgi:pimeloyl-ACP methyl ester carboxylesterase
MKLPEWTKPALTGAVVGAVAVAIVGFSWGGWTTQGAAQDLARKEAVAAIAAALTPYCLERSQSDPNSVQLIAELKAASGFNRRGIVEKAGWATPLGAEKPDRELAQACQLAIVAAL